MVPAEVLNEQRVHQAAPLTFDSAKNYCVARFLELPLTSART
jgi:hypothetical protein